MKDSTDETGVVGNIVFANNKEEAEALSKKRMEQLHKTPGHQFLSHWFETFSKLMMQTNEEIKLLRQAVHRYESAKMGVDINTEVNSYGCNCKFHMEKTSMGAWECPRDGNVKREAVEEKESHRFKE